MMNVIDLSDEDSPEIGPLTFEDVEPYLQKTIESPDTTIAESLKNIRRFAAQNRVRRVNANFRKLKEVWPEGTAIDFFVAFEMFANQTDKELRNELMNPANTRKVEREVENRRKGNPSLNQIVIPSVFFTEMPDDDEENDKDDDDTEYSCGENSDVLYFDQKRKYVHWTEEELNLFIYLMKTESKKMTWANVAKQFHNRTGEQCHNLYYRLRREKRINDIFVAKRESKEDKLNSSFKEKQKTLVRKQVDSSVIEKYNHIRSLIFTCGKQRAIVGPQTRKMKDNACRNPLFRCKDYLTEQPMFVPAISPYGTVLDYETWMQIMDKDQIDPKFFKKITSKSDIKILTDENFSLYKEKIKNLSDIGYKGSLSEL